MKQKKLINIILILVVLIITVLFIKFPNKTKTDDIISEIAYDLNVKNYTVYNTNDLNFRFVVVNITNNKLVDEVFDLKDLKINNKNLDNYQKLLNEVENKKFKEIDLNIIDKSLDLNKETLTLFIPIVDYNTTKFTTSINDGYLFDVNMEANVIKSLTAAKDGEIENDLIDTKFDYDGFSLKFNSIFRNNEFKYLVDGVEFDSSTQETLHAIEVELISLDSQIYEISEAIFIFDDFDGSLEAKEGGFETREALSILNYKTDDSINGSIIFITYSENESDLYYNGILKIKINNQNWLEFKVTI